MRRHLLTALAVGGALAVLVSVGVRHFGSDQRELVSAVGNAEAVSLTDPSARFALLAKRHTNQCGLRAQSLESLARDGRLQGSCCSPMDYAHYTKQLRGLKKYAGVAEIPRDPYDVSVALAKRLIAYDGAIELTSSEQSAYEQATKLGDEHGPCCCRCWRWSAFEGQARYLISRRDYTARQIAELWDIEDGCGGPSEHA